MSRIKIVDESSAKGIRKLLLKNVKKQYGGFIPSVIRLLLVDLKLGKPAGSLYQYLNFKKNSPISRMQKEMIATVVNGAIGGAP
jgi:formate-dependent nitrite reductase membrane component NrfD